jgi:iron complex transport system ATP-binding protein
MITLKTHQLKIEVGKKQICHSLSVDFKGGEFWVLLGNNGSGKTTLLHTLAGLQSATKGNILLSDDLQEIEISARSLRKQIAKRLGLLLQSTIEKTPTTVFEAVLTGRYAHIKPWSWEKNTDYAICLEAIKHMHLEALQSRFTNTLSGGESRRVAIATILAQHPKIYLLDEPINHLDLPHQIRVLNHFRQLANQGNIVIASMHDINLAYLFCDHALMLLNQNQILSGHKHDIFKTELLEALYQHPFNEIDMISHKAWFAHISAD